MAIGNSPDCMYGGLKYINFWFMKKYKMIDSDDSSIFDSNSDISSIEQIEIQNKSKVKNLEIMIEKSK